MHIISSIFKSIGKFIIKSFDYFVFIHEGNKKGMEKWSVITI
jgi:hypothetical protein